MDQTVAPAPSAPCAPPAAEREVLSWAEFGSAGRDLASVIAADGYRPDVLLGIARGGLPLTASLAYALGVKKVATINVEFYTGVDSRLPEPLVLPPALDPTGLSGLDVLVVDDVADTGRTLLVVADLVRRWGARPRTAVVYEKPGSQVRPDYAWRSTDRWIDYPWSVEPEVTYPADV